MMCTPNNNDENNVHEERFLIKWDDLSYPHCMWETEGDVLKQIERAKTLIKAFFKKASNVCCCDFDERSDDEFFDPSLNQIERIFKVVDPKNNTNSYNNYSDDNTDATSKEKKWGVIMDLKHPDFKNGAGRKFAIEFSRVDCAEAKLEFECDDNA